MSTVLQSLFETIQSRKENPPPGSYTAKLFATGENEICKKIGEEAVEVIIAAKGEGEDRIIYEMSDLIYHCMVLLAQRNLTWAQIEAELTRRHQ
jgi:phosphoribosyl-ATP pyrophosphohydrolase